MGSNQDHALRGPEMATIDVTEENFHEITGGDGIAILDFWATWCGACRAFAPVYEAASEEHPDIVFGKVDTEAAAQLSAEIGIRALPTVAVYRDSIRVFFRPVHCRSRRWRISSLRCGRWTWSRSEQNSTTTSMSRVTFTRSRRNAKRIGGGRSSSPAAGEACTPNRAVGKGSR